MVRNYHKTVDLYLLSLPFQQVSSLVPESGLLGHSVDETALVDQWVHFAEFEIIFPTGIFYGGIVAKVIPKYSAEV